MDATEGVAAYIAGSIARSRIEAAKGREAMLQRVQLEGGRIIDDADGVAAVRVDCPACSAERLPREAFDLLYLAAPAAAYSTISTIEVIAPFGLQSRETSYQWVDTSELADDVLIWAVRKGVLKIEPNTAVLGGLSENTEREFLENLPRVGRAIHRGTRERLERMTAKQVREAQS